MSADLFYSLTYLITVILSKASRGRNRQGIALGCADPFNASRRATATEESINLKRSFGFHPQDDSIFFVILRTYNVTLNLFQGLTKTRMNTSIQKILKQVQNDSTGVTHNQSRVVVDISLDCNETVTNQAAKSIFQIWLETCLARCFRASFLLLPSEIFF